MILKTGTFNGMAQDIIKSDNKIILFGTGVIGATITPQILKEYNLLDRLLYCVDNDKTRWNTFIKMCGREIKILSPDILTKIHDKITILFTMSRYGTALEQIRTMQGLEEVSCYIIPALCINSFHSKGDKGILKTSTNPLIPKTIHYMWLGGKKIPKNLQRCIDSWKEYCPNYEIIRWDESNYDVHKNKFMAQAYDNQRYGFVPDYARLEILYQYGGIYLDTDVELQRNIDDLLYQEAFCSVEKWQVLNFGGCSGSVKGHKSLEPFLESWSNCSLVRTDGTIGSISSGWIDTSIAIKAGYRINGNNQSINGMNIYTYDYFHPYDYMSGKIESTNDTFSIHHFNGGWLDAAAKKSNAEVARNYGSLMKTAINVDKEGC